VIWKQQLRSTSKEDPKSSVMDIGWDLEDLPIIQPSRDHNNE